MKAHCVRRGNLWKRYKFVIPNIISPQKTALISKNLWFGFPITRFESSSVKTRLQWRVLKTYKQILVSSCFEIVLSWTIVKSLLTFISSKSAQNRSRNETCMIAKGIFLSIWNYIVSAGHDNAQNNHFLHTKVTKGY